ncbi:DUF3971 domain-containing protein [Microvirga sp. GCM10011540]|uniref:YhdP family protein n=1 Tax=Microvirga sp. GCM10011540 TaxID=3317338 RepID=UPI003619D4FD
MKRLISTKPRRRNPAKRSALRRALRGALYVKLALVLVAGLGIGMLYLRLSAGPLSFGRLPEQVAETLAARIGPGWTVTLRDTAIELQRGSPALRANGLDIRAPTGELVLRAPYAVVSVDGFSLLGGSLQPKSVEFKDLQLRVLVNRDGSLTFSPGSAEGAETVATQEPQVSPSQEAAAALLRSSQGPSQVSGVVGSLFDLIVGPKSALNSLGQARLTNASLVFVDADQKVRARFKRLDATFDWSEDGGRHFAATLDGPQGVWQIDGDAKADGHGGYRASMVADRAPIQDILLLAGLSALPATTDLEFSGRFDAAYAGGRVTELTAKLDSSAGFLQIDDKDTSPLQVQQSSIDVAWDEPGKALDLRMLELVGGDTRVRLQGRLATQTGADNWRLSLRGKDATLAGATVGDKPVRIGEIAAELSGPDGIGIRSLKLRGPELSADISGVLGKPSDPYGLDLTVDAAKTDLRAALRIWPEAVAPPVRRFLVANARGGILESIALKVKMTGAVVAKAVAGGPIPDDSLKIDFAVSQGVLSVAEGLAPLSRVDMTGLVTGTKVMLRAPTGRIDMAGPYGLDASGGTFVLDNYWKDGAVAQIDFRLAGPADGLGALLQQPLIREIAGFDVDPATMKGSADLRVGIGLPVDDIPAFADLPLTVRGTVSDLGIDKVFGKDRLEGATLAVAYEKGSLAIKGEGKLGGGPASIDVQKTHQGGEANVSFILDEAARSKRGLSFGSQLTGAFPVKATMPLGKDAKPGIRIEADLTKAAVDQIIPGWVKPAGRPGKLSFVYVEGPTGEIHDLQLDSGSTQLRGSASLSNDGNLEKAELTTFKLSPGDDMRAQIERSNGVFKVTVRGNVGDARPFTKTATASAPGARNAQRESRDFDLDLVLNILTGYNEEAITNASIKASLRKDNIRQLDLKGRLGATNIIARTAPQPAGNPVITLQAEDAGALLRFLDVYKRMTGGELIIQLATGDGPQAGILNLRSFALNNEPALRRIIPTQTQFIPGQDRAGNPQAVRVDVNEVVFTKARVDFTRTAGRLDFKDAAIFGGQVGFTLGGYIDYARDRMDIAGTFVPAYGLNNAFAQVPLFGPLLGGGQYEGLFAVNFRVSGEASAPTLTVNPLSAVAPGFLRKLFGVGGAPQAGALPTVPER